jgi:hypothetical protein
MRKQALKGLVFTGVAIKKRDRGQFFNRKTGHSLIVTAN